MTDNMRRIQIASQSVQNCLDQIKGVAEDEGITDIQKFHYIHYYQKDLGTLVRALNKLVKQAEVEAVDDFNKEVNR